jgi:hypothetical protein
MDIERGDEREEINWVEEDISVWSVEELKYAGCVVVVMTPNQLGDEIDCSNLEDLLVAKAFDYIDTQ